MVLSQVLDSNDELLSLSLSAELGTKAGLSELGGSLKSRSATDLDELHHVALIRGETSDLSDNLANESLLATTELLSPVSLDLLGDESLTTSCSNTASSHDY